MHGIRRPLIAVLGLAITLTLTALGPRTAEAAPKAKGPEPYTTVAHCNTWVEAGPTNPRLTLCAANLDAIPAGKRFVVEYVSVRAYTDNASSQKLLVETTFFSGSSTPPKTVKVNTVLQFQATFGDRDLYHASEKVLAFAENVPGYPVGQLLVNRTTDTGIPTTVDLWASGYLEDMD